MKAIQTHYLGPTNTRGSRIVATAERQPAKPWRVVIPYDHRADDPHKVAALALCKRLGWHGTLIQGGLPNGDSVFVFYHGDRIEA